ncbi:MAG: TetR/AcrR family transcriptional regulator [Pseudomonadota bacterium]|jgi:TetR/AcrR family transcriptional repressor of uid operon|nr:MAG: TetR/AcrR family transcriptional regulator [Pseudomonadota bacterium]
MPKLKPSTQAARREHILDAAERCFARSGFHRTTMQDICREAQVSPGALYLYFSSKEELIAGIAERDRTHLAQQLAELGKAGDLIAALRRIAEHYSIEEPRHKRVLCMEIAAESTRNPVVGEIFRSVDRYVTDSFAQLFAEAQKAGRINPVFPPQLLAQIIVLIGDGLFWRRAVDPDYDAETMLPALVQLVSTLINPVSDGSPQKQVASDSAASR